MQVTALVLDKCLKMLDKRMKIMYQCQTF